MKKRIKAGRAKLSGLRGNKVSWTRKARLSSVSPCERNKKNKSTNIIKIEDNSKNVIINTDDNSTNTIFVTNNNSRNLKINCGKNSKVKYIELNNSKNENEIKRELILSKDAVLDFYNIYLGSKNQTSSTLAELNEKSEIFVKNIFISDAQEHNHDLKVVHKQKNSKSRLESRGVLSNSKMNIKGLIKIEQDADESEGYQKSDLLILRDSTAVSIPDLEIKNNNVKCSHGSSITRLDKEKIFYLQTRGLDETKAKEVLINAFFSSILENLEEEEKEKLNNLISEKLALIVK
jgi:Fe-S cluster assembly protein SufD